MSAVIGAISKPLEYFANQLKRYIESRKIRDQFLYALCDEITDFQKNFQGIIDLTTDALIPIIEKSKDSPLGIDDANQIVDYMNYLLPMYSKLWESFIRLVRGMHEVSSYPAFMENLKETNSMLYDFTVSMGNMLVKSDMVMINRNFLRFFKLYEKQLSKGICDKEMDEATKKFDQYLELIQKKIIPILNKKVINRRAQKTLLSNIKCWLRIASKVRIEREVESDFKAYVPPQFVAVFVLVENSKILKSSIGSRDKEPTHLK